MRTLSLRGDDKQTRARVSFAHEVDAIDSAMADSLQWQLYRQDSETTQRTVEDRVSVVGGREVSPTRREREFNFDQRLVGLDAVLHKDIRAGSVEHALTYGVELTRTEFKQKRDGRATNLTTGTVTKATILSTLRKIGRTSSWRAWLRAKAGNVTRAIGSASAE